MRWRNNTQCVLVYIELRNPNSCITAIHNPSIWSQSNRQIWRQHIESWNKKMNNARVYIYSTIPMSITEKEWHHWDISITKGNTCARNKLTWCSIVDSMVFIDEWCFYDCDTSGHIAAGLKAMTTTKQSCPPHTTPTEGFVPRTNRCSWLRYFCYQSIWYVLLSTTFNTESWELISEAFPGFISFIPSDISSKFDNISRMICEQHD